jgi:hypothetical protein
MSHLTFFMAGEVYMYKELESGFADINTPPTVISKGTQTEEDFI